MIKKSSHVATPNRLLELGSQQHPLNFVHMLQFWNPSKTTEFDSTQWQEHYSSTSLPPSSFSTRQHSIFMPWTPWKVPWWCHGKFFYFWHGTEFKGQKGCLRYGRSQLWLNRKRGTRKFHEKKVYSNFRSCLRENIPSFISSQVGDFTRICYVKNVHYVFKKSNGNNPGRPKSASPASSRYSWGSCVSKNDGSWKKTWCNHG